MSVIVAVKKEGKCVIASDSLFTEGSQLVQAKYKKNSHKLYKVGSSWVGLVGWAALNNIFESIIKEHKNMLDFSNRQAIFSTLIQLHAIMKEEYFIETNEDSDQPVESSQADGIVINENGIFDFDSYREVNEYSHFWSLGSGRRYALGALHASFTRVKNPKDIATIAVHAACDFDDGCGLPIQVKTLKLKK